MASNSDNILWIAPWWPSPSNPTFGIFIKEQAKALTEAGYCITVIHVDIKKSRGLIRPWKIELTDVFEDGIRVIKAHIQTKIRRFGLHDYLVKRAFKLAFDKSLESLKPRFIHLHVRDHISRHAFELEAIRKLPLIHTEHFSFYHRGINLLNAPEKKSQTEALIKWFQNSNLKKFIPVSKELGDVIIRNFKLDPSKVTIIGNVASKSFYFDSNIKLENKICLVASWHSPKNPKLFFEAFLQLTDQIKNKFEIVVFGEGPLLADCKMLIESASEPIQVSFRGFQTKEIISKELRTSAFLVHPSDQENLPTSIIEALCCGVPVLSMDINGIPELVNSKNGILVQPKDDEALLNGLREMIEKIDTFNRAEIANEALSRFSPESIANAYLRIYQQYL